MVGQVTIAGEADSASPAFVGPCPWAAQVLSLCCAAYEYPSKRIVPIAAALELLGIVSCGLDAAQDRDQVSLQYYGTSFTDTHTYHQHSQTQIALISNAAVALIGLAWQALLEYGPPYGIPSTILIEIGQLLAARWSSICQAQHQDLTVGRTLLSLGSYMEIVTGKAGVIGGTICEAGAILAGCSAHDRALWYQLGLERTIAQQLCDDCRDLDQDLATGQQLSLPVLYGLEVAEPSTRLIIERLIVQSRGDSPAATAARRHLISLIEELGAAHYAAQCQVEQQRAAIAVLRDLALPPIIETALQRWVADVSPPILVNTTHSY